MSKTLRVKTTRDKLHTSAKALLVITIAATLMASCVLVPVPADLESVTLTQGEAGAIEVGENIVVLALDELTPPPDQLKCVQSSITETEPNFPLLESGKFLDAVFPWFEPSVSPKNQETLAKTLTRTGVRKVIAALSVKYMVLVGDVESFEGDIEGPWGPKVMMPAGVGWVEKSAEMAASIWDLEEASLVGTLSVKASGETLLVTWLITLALIPMTEAKACEELGRQLALFMTGQQLSDPEKEPPEAKRSK